MQWPAARERGALVLCRAACPARYAPSRAPVCACWRRILHLSLRFAGAFAPRASARLMSVLWCVQPQGSAPMAGGRGGGQGPGAAPAGKAASVRRRGSSGGGNSGVVTPAGMSPGNVMQGYGVGDGDEAAVHPNVYADGVHDRGMPALPCICPGRLLCSGLLDARPQRRDDVAQQGRLGRVWVGGARGYRTQPGRVLCVPAEHAMRMRTPIGNAMVCQR